MPISDGDTHRSVENLYAAANMGPDAGGDAWWQATVRTLQILDAVNRNTDRIGPRIQQLRQQDPGLGGERWRRALETLEQKHA